MSYLRVNSITNSTLTSGPTFSKGLAIGAGSTLNANLNVTGIVTATAFVGNGANITGISGLSVAQAIAFNTIF